MFKSEAAWQTARQSSFGIILATNSGLKSTSLTRTSVALMVSGKPWRTPFRPFELSMLCVTSFILLFFFQRWQCLGRLLMEQLTNGPFFFFFFSEEGAI